MDNAAPGWVSAIFPLQSPLLPGMAIDLVVFEPRYRTMFGDLDRDGSGFGVVLIERGGEVGGGDQRAPIGTLATVLDSVMAPDGRRACTIVGTERFRVEEWLVDDPYPRAAVSLWPDEVDAAPDVATAKALYRQLCEVSVAGPMPLVDLDALIDDAMEESDVIWRLALAAPLGSYDRYRLLAAPSTRERAERLCLALSEQLDLH